MTTSLRITPAEPAPENLRTILGLIEEAVDWLRDKGTSQWAKPWPDESRRDLRIVKELQVRKTWIVWDGDRPAATVTTATRANLAVWTDTSVGDEFRSAREPGPGPDLMLPRAPAPARDAG